MPHAGRLLATNLFRCSELGEVGAASCLERKKGNFKLSAATPTTRGLPQRYRREDSLYECEFEKHLKW